MQQRARVGERRRIELQFGIARPPRRAPRPGGRAEREHVLETMELAGVIVEDGKAHTERGGGERHAVGEQGHERHDGERAPRGRGA